MTRKVLGRGLGALIPSRTPEHPQPPPAAAAHQPGLLQLDIGKIVPNPNQPRKEFAADKLDELSASIAARGLIQPVIVRPLGDGRYELIAGERRWRAAGQAGLARIPAVVRHAESAEALELALIENIQREDLNPIETAKAYRYLAETFDFSHEEVAAKVGKDRSSVTNLLRLLNLPEEIQKDVAAGTLSMGHARALLGIPDRAAQLAARATVLAGGLVGAMMSRGFDKEVANFYDQALQRGQILVSVEEEGPDAQQRLALAEEIFAGAGAETLSLPEG